MVAWQILICQVRTTYEFGVMKVKDAEKTNHALEVIGCTLFQMKILGCLDRLMQIHI